MLDPTLSLKRYSTDGCFSFARQLPHIALFFFSWLLKSSESQKNRANHNRLCNYASSPEPAMLVSLLRSRGGAHFAQIVNWPVHAIPCSKIIDIFVVLQMLGIVSHSVWENIWIPVPSPGLCEWRWPKSPQSQQPVAYTAWAGMRWATQRQGFALLQISPLNIHLVLTSVWFHSWWS